MADNDLMTGYQQLVSSYQAIDNFRAQLLGRLPLATGAGIFLLYAADGNLSDEMRKLLPRLLPYIGLFGIIVTLGLFVYEIYGIMKCTALINTGKQMEGLLGIGGQFQSRPSSFFNEPFAAGLIYPAVLAAWSYLPFAYINSDGQPYQPYWIIALLVFVVFLAGTMGYNLKLYLDGKGKDLAQLNQEILYAEEHGDRGKLGKLLHPGFTIVRSNGDQQDKEEYLNSILYNKNRGRKATYTNIQRVGRFAIYTGIVTTTQDPDGASPPGRFWNTWLFVKVNERWRCLSWQVMKVDDG